MDPQRTQRVRDARGSRGTGGLAAEVAPDGARIAACGDGDAPRLMGAKVLHGGAKVDHHCYARKLGDGGKANKIN